jgi:predicted MFS family arabinose efflux permease
VRLGDRQSGSVYGQMAGLLHRPPFLWGLLAFFCNVTASTFLYFLLPFDMSAVQHIAPAHADLILLCVPLGVGVIGTLGGYLTDRYRAPPFLLAGSGLLLVGLIALTLIVRSPAAELNLAWRLLLSGIGIGLFTSPNQTRLMNKGARETMGAASVLSNLVSRLGSVCGPLVLGLVWTFLDSFSAQMTMGILLIDGFALPLPVSLTRCLIATLLGRTSRCKEDDVCLRLSPRP